MAGKNDDFEMDRVIGEQLSMLEHLSHENKRLREALEWISELTPWMDVREAIQEAKQALKGGE